MGFVGHGVGLSHWQQAHRSAWRAVAASGLRQRPQTWPSGRTRQNGARSGIVQRGQASASVARGIAIRLVIGGLVSVTVLVLATGAVRIDPANGS
jgi:anti-sigma factor RsiW